MKNLLGIGFILFVSSIILNAQCTSAQKAKMIVNGVDQLTIDKTCSKKTVKTVTKKKRKLKRYAIKRDRIYTSVAISKDFGILKNQNSWFLGDKDISIDASSLKIAIGYVFKNNTRVEFSYTTEQAELDPYYSVYTSTEFTSMKLNYIYPFGNKQVEIGSFRPFVMVGAVRYDSDMINEDAQETEVYALGLNLGLGVIYSLNNYIELDLSYENSFVVWDGYYSLWVGEDVIFEKSTNSFTATIRYKF